MFIDLGNKAKQLLYTKLLWNIVWCSRSYLVYFSVFHILSTVTDVAIFEEAAKYLRGEMILGLFQHNEAKKWYRPHIYTTCESAECEMRE